MSATMSTATAVEAPTTVDRACPMQASTTVNYTAPGVSSSIAMSVTANVAASIAPAWATPTSAPPIPRPTVVSAMSPAPVVPGSGADKDSACKPLWAIEAVRRASIRVIGIVAVRAYRRTAHISWPGVRLIGIAPVGIPLIGWALIGWTLVRVTSIGLTLVVTLIVSSRSSRIDLRLRVRKRQHQHCQQRQVFHVAHISPLGSRAPTSISTGHLLWSSFGLPVTANYEPEPLLI